CGCRNPAAGLPAPAGPVMGSRRLCGFTDDHEGRPVFRFSQLGPRRVVSDPRVKPDPGMLVKTANADTILRKFLPRSSCPIPELRAASPIKSGTCYVLFAPGKVIQQYGKEGSRTPTCSCTTFTAASKYWKRRRKKAGE